eukprot:51091-Eustigmatos_ZCMA.PRE.1
MVPPLHCHSAVPTCVRAKQDPRWCSYFKEYINHALEADFIEAKVTSGTAERTRELATNYLQFWLDVSG